jgi:hypothetical protein
MTGYAYSGERGDDDDEGDEGDVREREREGGAARGGERRAAHV